jgi:hypothetical protein
MYALICIVCMIVNLVSNQEPLHRRLPYTFAICIYYRSH